MTMAHFEHASVTSLDELAASRSLNGPRSAVIAGGTDLLGILKDRVHPEHPQLLIDIKPIDEMHYVRVDDAQIRIGALSTLAEIANDEIVNAHIPLLSQAARAVGSPQIRNMATVGGNICQEPRCWYYRAPNNTFDCLRKGGAECPALLGDNRYHSIFGSARPTLAPCVASCPAQIDIPGYLGLIRAGDWQSAARLLLERNPIPAVTGRICPHFCEDSCNRLEIDDAVATREIERHLGDRVLEDIASFFEAPKVLTDKKVAIVGSGPAGLSAAYYLRKSGHAVSIFDSFSAPGGMLRFAIPRYRLPLSVVERQIEAFRHMGIEFVSNQAVDESVLARLRSEFDATFLATGAWRDKSLGIEGAEHLESGLQFLIDIQNGLHEQPGETVVVIGGGGVAVDVAVSARRLGARTVTMVCLEARDVMPALPEEIDHALEEGVKILPSWGPKRLVMSGDNVAGMELVRCTSAFDAAGHFNPSFDDNTTLVLDADCILLGIGQEPDLAYLDSVGLRDRSRISAAPSGATSLPGVFAGGDAVSGPASVVEALAGGRQAALAIDAYLRGSTHHEVVDGGVQLPSLLKVRAAALSVIPPVPVSIASPLERDLGSEDVQTLDFASVLEEAGRCLDCACIAVNASDLAPALVALGARMRTTKRVIEAERFFSAGVMSTTVLDSNEVVLEVEIPLPEAPSIQRYRKFRNRNSIDFPIVSVASILSLDGATIAKASVVLGAVAPVPLRAQDVERFLVGRQPNEESAQAAAALALRTTSLLAKNAFKAQILSALMREAVLEVADAPLDGAPG